MMTVTRYGTTPGEQATAHMKMGDHFARKGWHDLAEREYARVEEIHWAEDDRRARRREKEEKR